MMENMTQIVANSKVMILQYITFCASTRKVDWVTIFYHLPIGKKLACRGEGRANRVS